VCKGCLDVFKKPTKQHNTAAANADYFALQKLSDSEMV